MSTAKKIDFPSDRSTPPASNDEKDAAPRKLYSKKMLKLAWPWRVLAALATLGILAFYLYTDWRNQERIKAENFQEADVLIDQALMEFENDPDKVEIDSQCQPPLGESRMRLERARQKINRASSLAPDYARAKTALGIYHIKMCERAAAKKLFQDSVAMDKKYALAYLNLGALSYQDGQLDQALEQFEHAAELDQINPHPLVNIAVIWHDREEFKKASDYLLRASKMKPGNPDIKYLLGMTYYLDGRTTEAVLQLREAIRLDKSNSMALYYLALACREAGNHAEAIEHLQSVLTLNPGLQRAYSALGDSLIQSGRPDEAEEILKTCIRKWPDFRDCSEFDDRMVPKFD